ncbi:Peptidase family M50 [Vibrio aerogenes CECT 7868]|uniref:Peptidase family M50 n=1 Tax=Vibrio aerogenes CECT 7868 TaxID=1216006 RepID=A0A1M5ZSW2_9VIBR|nr:HlyD family efflux transporter periplasmic adaptor subunit [Vibrio aerogenes]SHI27199.1 Peptidase family M50 [Vibrio aerogenes CECT 7868]
MMGDGQIPLPPLRQELRLHPAPDDVYGAPRRTLEDPIRGRFYQLGWLETEFLANWSDSPEKVLRDVRNTTTLRPDEAALTSFSRFLSQNHLVHLDVTTLEHQLAQQQRQEHWFFWLMKRHLAFRIPLCQPDPWLSRCLPLLLPLMSRAFVILSLIAALLGLWLASRQWEHFTHGFSYLFSVQGAVISVVTIIGVKAVHELGHAFTCKKYQVPVSTMGMTFILFWPVLYTDVTGAWRIKEKHRRIMISAAGMLTEALIAAWALLWWNFVDDSILRSVLFTLATTSLFLSLSVNLSPLMRFDGYFIFSDWLDMPNLQSRAFAMARWAIRKALFGWQIKPPESLPLSRQRTVIVYAFATWIYRCMLYFGIALAVYHLVFKALGLLLFLAEIVYLLGIPLAKEIHNLIKNRDKLTMNGNMWRTLGVSGVLITALLVPWHHTISAPAVLMAEKQQQLFVKQSARLVKRAVVSGTVVSQGQLLFQFTSPELDQKIQTLDIRRISLEKQIRSYPFDRQASADLTVIRDELLSVKAQIKQCTRLIQQLTIRAPFSGHIAGVPETLTAGSLIPAGEVLATLTGDKGVRAQAYISEHDLSRVRGMRQGVFIADEIQTSVMTLSLERLAQGGVSDLRAHPGLSSPYGGPVAAHIDHRKQAPIPQQALYAASFTDPEAAAPKTQLRGEVVIEGQAQSLFSRMWNALVSVVIRESVM